MPIFELPLDQLREYHGRNPKPTDFDAYWDRGLRELSAVDPMAELRPVKTPALLLKCPTECAKSTCCMPKCSKRAVIGGVRAAIGRLQPRP
jgi:Acetyl xylan esterase (AXE1)